MTFYVFAISLAFPGLICLIVSRMIIYQDEKFKRKSIKTVGTIIGYDTEDNSSWETPQVQCIIEGKMKVVMCNSSKINSKILPPHSEINIRYLKKSFFKIFSYDVRLVDDGLKPIDNKIVAFVIFCIGILLWTLVVVFIIIGLNS